MARIASVTGSNMGWILATSPDAIVAIDTVTDKTCVIRGTTRATRGREPGRRRMANIALFYGN